MSTLHKVKAYFGMAPMEDYEDEYYDDDRAPGRGYPRHRFEDGYRRYDGRDYDDPHAEPDDYPPGGYRGGYADDHRFRARDYDRTELARPRFGLLRARPAAPWRWTRAGWR